MKMKPVLFSTPMVQAILEGRKTMTRRVIKPQPITSEFISYSIAIDGNTAYFHGEGTTRPIDSCVLKFVPGDVLWVRETRLKNAAGGITPYFYRADDNEAEVLGQIMAFGYKWRPSIFMPHEGTRLFLRVTDVRVERVQDILCGDMMAEGCIPKTVTGGQWQQWQREYWVPLWDSINAKRGFGWDVNPWVGVYAFERVSKEEVIQEHSVGKLRLLNTEDW